MIGHAVAGQWIRARRSHGQRIRNLHQWILPPADAHKQQAPDDPDVEFSPSCLEEVENYESMDIDGGAAAKEFVRMLEAKYAIDLPHKFWRAPRQGHVHRMALITKVRRDGVTKHRIIVDMRSSEANGRARSPERPVPTRPCDAVQTQLKCSRTELLDSDPVLLRQNFATWEMILGPRTGDRRLGRCLHAL